MNNIANSYFDYIGATGTYSTRDYIDYTCNINYLYSSNSSNINYLYSSNSSNILDNKIDNLINTSNTIDYIDGSLYNVDNTYIYNNNQYGEIRFKTHINNSNYYVKIGRNGKLYLWIEYNIFRPEIAAGWYEVSDILADYFFNLAIINFTTAAIGADVAFIQAQVTTINIQIESIIDALFIHTVQINKLIELQEATLVNELLNSTILDPLTVYQNITARGINSISRISTGTASLLTLGGVGLFGWIASGTYGYFQALREEQIEKNMRLKNIYGELLLNSNTSNLDIPDVNNAGYTLKQSLYSNIYSNLSNINSNEIIYETNRINTLGFINSNILTTQKIPNITTSNIIVNNTGSTTYSTINFSNATNNSAGYIGLGGIVSGYHNNNMLYNTPKAHIFNVPGQNSLSIPAFSINASACVGININPSAYPLYRLSVDGDVYIHNAALRTNSIIYNSQELSTTLNNYLLLSGGTLTDTIIFNTGLFDNPSPSPQGFNGDRIVLQAGIGTNGYPYSIGINTNVFWFSSPSTSSYKFYSGAINTATLNNTGLLTLPSISATTSISTNSIIYNSQELSTTLTNYLLKEGGTMTGRIVFNTGYYQDPSPTGFGDRIVLQSGGLGYPYSIGINTDVFWHSAPSTASYKFYSGGTNTATLNNTGLLTLSSINATTSITTPSIIYGGSELNTTLGNYLLKSGGTMTGQLAITANSASSLISLTNTGTVGQGILQTNNLGGYARLTYYNSGAGGYYTGNYVLEASSNNACIVLNTGGNNSNSIPRIILLASGNVGIGISNPSAKLEVNGKIGCIGTLNCWSNVGIGATNPYTLLHVRGTNPALTIMAQGGSGATSTINLSTYDHTTNSTNCALIATDNGNFGSTFQIRQKLAGADTNGLFTSFIMNVDGNVGIGTTTVAGIKLYVGGKATFQDIITLPNGQWNKSADGVDRFYYNTNGTTFFHSGNSDPAFVFRSFAQSDIVTISNSGNIAGNNINGSVGTFSGNLSSGTNSYVYAGAMRIGGWDANSFYNGFRDIGITCDVGKNINFNMWGGNGGTMMTVNNNNVVMNTLTRSRNYFNRGETLNYSASFYGYNAGGWYWMTNGYWQDISTVSYLCIAITCLGINSVWFGRCFLGQGGGFYQLICDMRNPNGGTNTIDVYDIWGSTGQNGIRIVINNGSYGGQFNIKISG
jgi:hypothetical protein